ncbi:MAG: hypothetical protein LJE97_02705 [Betaproteobacteria bacterium]|nr:hypothetical protein [Betaproteobacteria bacterium]
MTAKINRSKFDLAFTGLGLVGVAKIVLPFIATMLWRAPGRREMIAPGQGQVSYSTGGTT